MKQVPPRLNFNDMLKTFRMMRKMGTMKGIMKVIPGLGTVIPEKAFDKINDKETAKIEAIILSMTPAERSSPDIIDGSRRMRIARGSGTSIEQVNSLMTQFSRAK